jgi:hypothetical protein
MAESDPRRMQGFMDAFGPKGVRAALTMRPVLAARLKIFTQHDSPVFMSVYLDLLETIRYMDSAAEHI